MTGTHLWDYFNLGLPEGGFLSGWVQHGYLAGILPRGKLAEWNAEAERHGLQMAVQLPRYLHRLRLEGFCLLVIEAYKSDDGLLARCTLFIRL